MEKVELGEALHLKAGEDSRQPSPDTRPWGFSRFRDHVRRWRLIYFSLLLVLYLSSAVLRAQRRAHPRTRFPSQNDDETRDSQITEQWLDIVPSEKLTWQPCFATYGPNLQCARLTVPMDYNRPLNESADHPKVHLALVMATGMGRSSDPATYAEAPLLVNPGGPGGSGVELIQTMGQNLHYFVGQQHDIIGFDPRGVGASTPRADCFSVLEISDDIPGRNMAYMNRLSWLAGEQGVGLANSSTTALTQLNARARALGKLCQKRDETESDDSIFRHMSTPNSARDMLAIIQAWDAWKSSGHARQSEQDLETECVPDDNANDSPRVESSLRGKLVYWGFSYGTVLGATFASMFPDKIGRVVLDGVVHADHYVGPMWEKFVTDADAIWDHFFIYCAEAREKCDFYRPGDRPEDIRRRFDEMLASLEKSPAIVLLPEKNRPALVTAGDVKTSIFFGALYEPIVGFPLIAEMLDHAFRGTLGEIARGSNMVSLCGNISLPLWPDDATRAVACSDKRYKLDADVAELQSRFEQAASYSWFADVWFSAKHNIGCNGWGIESKEPLMQWDDYPAQEPPVIETSFPILFLSNTLDPVTPLHHALYMSRKFANSSLVVQEAVGHSTISCISSCTLGHLQAYLNGGIVPATYNDDECPSCECTERPWKPSAWEPRMTTMQMRAYEGMRAKFAISRLSQHLDMNNPLGLYLLERHSLADGFRGTAR